MEINRNANKRKWTYPIIISQILLTYKDERIMKNVEKDESEVYLPSPSSIKGAQK